MKTIKSTVAVLLTTSLLFGCGQKEETKPAADKTEKTAAASSNLDQVSAEYRDYAILEIEEFVKETEAFTNAVISGDIEKAKELYAPARMHYERAEPIAEVFGDLDPKIDARDGDVEEIDWGGYHRIEIGRAHV